MKNRIRFNNLVVSAEDLPKIEKIVKLLTELSPSDAFISVDFVQSMGGFEGKLQLSSPSENFSESANNPGLVELMERLSDLTMVRIEEWRKDRFAEPEIKEKIIS